MKNVLKWALLAGMLLAGTAAMGQVKLGFIDSGELFQAMPERDSADVKMQAFAAELQEQLEVMQVELNNKVQEYLKMATTVNETVRASKENELDGLRTRLAETQQLFQQDYNNMQQTLVNPILEKMNAAIEKVSKANGMTAVLDLAAQAMVYHDTATMTDLLPLVKAELGIK